MSMMWWVVYEVLYLLLKSYSSHIPVNSINDNRAPHCCHEQYLIPLCFTLAAVWSMKYHHYRLKRTQNTIYLCYLNRFSGMVAC